MDQIGLYYPYIVPPESWIKTGLLLFDQISTIARDVDANSSDLLEWLGSEGLWTPTYASALSNREYQDEVETVLLTLSEDERFRRASSSDSSYNFSAACLKLGKLNRFVEDGLKDLDLCSRVGDGLHVHDEVAAAVLAITARHTAAAHGQLRSRLVTSTDNPRCVSYAFDPIEKAGRGGIMRRRREGYQCLELLLDGVVPTPGPLVSIPDVVDFRRRYRDEAVLLRQHVDALVETITVSEDPLETFRGAREGIELAIRSLKAAARRRFKLGAGSVAIVATSVLAVNSVNPDLARWVFDGIGTAATGSVVRRAVRGRPATNPFTYLVRAEQRFGGA